MNKTGLVIILLCSLAAAAVVLWEQRKVRKTMEEIERMLDAAMTGSFSEITFDESQLSALETKFAHYLSAAEASSRNMAQEKDKIKSLIAGHFPPDENADCKPAVIQRTFDGGNSACIGKGKRGGTVQSEKLRFLIDSLVKLSRLENGITSTSTSKHHFSRCLKA